MRDRMERFVLLPFAVGCMSESSVAVTSSPQSHRRSPPSLHPPPTIITNDDEDDECSSKSSSSWNLPKPNLSSIGIDRLFKTFSHLFVYKEEEEEIEIGVPTDVKHVTHIGWDGVVVNNIRGAGGHNNTNINQQDTTLHLNDHLFLNNNERLQLRLSKTFNHHHQFPHPNSAAASASIPQTDGQDDHTEITAINPDHHLMIAAHHPSSSLQTNLEVEHNSVRTMGCDGYGGLLVRNN